MQQTFSIQRFYALMKSWWLIHQLEYTLAIIGIISLQILFVSFWYSSDHTFNQSALWTLFTWAFILGHYRMLAMAFSLKNDRNQLAQWLLFPTSSFEKFFIPFSWVSIVYPLVFIVSAVGLEAVFMHFGAIRHIENPRIYGLNLVAENARYLGTQYFKVSDGIYIYIISVWTIVQFMYYYFSLSFKRNIPFISAFLLFIFYYLYQSFNAVFFNATHQPFGSWYIWQYVTYDQDSQKVYGFPGYLSIIFHVGWVSVIVFLLYKACFYKIREITLKN